MASGVAPGLWELVLLSSQKAKDPAYVRQQVSTAAGAGPAQHRARSLLQSRPPPRPGRSCQPLATCAGACPALRPRTLADGLRTLTFELVTPYDISVCTVS